MRQRIAFACGIAVVVAVCFGVGLSGRPRPGSVRDSNSGSNVEQPSELEILAESFLDLSGAIPLARGSHRLTEAQPEPRLEFVEIPLRRIPRLSVKSTIRPDSRLPVDHLLLLVERCKNEALSDARVIGFMHTQSNTPRSIGGAVIVPTNLSDGHVVLSKSMDGGLNPIICRVDRGLQLGCKVGDLNVWPPRQWPNGLRVVADRRQPIASKATEIVSASYVEDERGRRIDMQFRDGRNGQCGLIVEYSYSLLTGEWTLQSSEDVWTLDEQSTEVIGMLPVAQKRNDRVVGAGTPRYCLAIVQQLYRCRSSAGKRPEGISPALWVVECPENCDLNRARTVGVIHPVSPFSGSVDACFRATKSCLISDKNGTKRYLLVAGSSQSSPEVRIFQLDRDRPLASSPLVLDANPKNWPPQMQVLRTEQFPYGGGGGVSLNEFYDRCGSPITHGSDSCVALATFTSFGSTKTIHGIDLRRNIATTVSVVEGEIAIEGKRRESSCEIALRSEAEDEWEAIPSTTRVLSILRRTRGEKLDGAGTRPRCLVAVEQEYRPVLKQLDARTRVLWILDCAPDCSIESGIPVGVQYLAANCRCIGVAFAAGQRCVVAVASSDESQLAIRLFADRFDRQLNCNALTLARRRSDWPAAMVPVAALETAHANVGMLSTMVEPDNTIIVRAAGEEVGEIAYRYRSGKNQWSRIVLSQRSGETGN